jgi:crossover junction endodeoxyribonuclease RuvC
MKEEEGTIRVLGVDPGTTVTGWGVVELCGRDLLCAGSGVIRARGGRCERLQAIYQALCRVCVDFSPNIVALEKSFVADNVQTALRLGEARGVVMVAAAGASLDVVEYSPAEIKVAVAGSGRAAKVQVQAMVARLLGLTRTLPNDEADALGAAICHIHSRRFAAAVSSQRLPRVFRMSRITARRSASKR